MKPSDALIPNSVRRKGFLAISIGFLPINIVIGISFVITVFAERIVPKNFNRDSGYIFDRINSSVSGFSDSFQIITDIYRFIGISEMTLLVRIIQWTLFLVAFQLSIRIGQWKQDRLNVFLISTFYYLCVPFFGTSLTKEIVIIIGLIIYTITFPWLLQRSSIKYISDQTIAFFLISALTLCCAIFLRKYYFLTFGFFLIYYLLSKQKILVIFKLFMPITLLSLISTLDYYFNLARSLSGQNVFGIRIEIQSNLGIEAVSSIRQDLISGSFISNFINFLQVLIQFIFPKSLFLPSFYYLGTFVLVIVTCLLLIAPYSSRRSSTYSSFLYAYLTSALIFEPDLGSFTRHSFVFFIFTYLFLTPLSTRWTEAKYSEKRTSHSRYRK